MEFLKKVAEAFARDRARMGDGETELSVRSRVPVPCSTPIRGHTAAFREAVASLRPQKDRQNGRCQNWAPLTEEATVIAL